MEKATLKKVSIVLPTYNGIKHIGESIKSCLEQTYKNIELIIVDDGSDIALGLTEMINNFKDNRIKYVRITNNQGLPNALNVGFNSAVGEYLTWTSDDNYYDRNAIEEMVNFLDNNTKIDFVYADFYIIDQGGQILKLCKADNPLNIDIHNVVGACFLFKKIIWNELGGFKKEWRLVEDYEYWLRVSQNFNMTNLNKALYYYRIHPDSLRSKNKVVNIEELAYNASLPYITKSAKYYRLAKIEIYQGKRISPIKKIFLAMLIKPSRLDYWKLLGLSFINLICKVNKKI